MRRSGARHRRRNPGTSLSCDRVAPQQCGRQQVGKFCARELVHTGSAPHVGPNVFLHHASRFSETAPCMFTCSHLISCQVSCFLAMQTRTRTSATHDDTCDSHQNAPAISRVAALPGEHPRQSASAGGREHREAGSAHRAEYWYTPGVAVAFASSESESVWCRRNGAFSASFVPWWAPRSAALAAALRPSWQRLREPSRAEPP